jgi:hypothetical protein
MLNLDRPDRSQRENNLANTSAPTYSAGAQKAAAGTPACASGGCPACVKTGLPVLLVRPGLADRKYAKDKQDAARPLLDMHTAEVALGYSSYAMRTLRAGFVVVYYETPHTPQLKADKGWQIFRVSDGGYLSPFPLEAVPYASSASGDDGFVCQRSDAYANAMLLVIPEAKEAGTVWVGYSDHPWSKPVRELYASTLDLRRRRMTSINASKGTAKRSMPLTMGAILTLIADYDEKMKPADLLDTPFPALSLQKEVVGKAGVRPETALQVIQAAQRLVDASQGRYTMDHVHMVSVPDAIGVTSESAYMRLTQCSSANLWLGKKQDGQWRLQTAMTIDGLLKEIEQRGNNAKQKMASFSKFRGQPITRPEFDEQQQSGILPPEASFVGDVEADGYGGVNTDTFNGTVRLPSDRQIDKETAGLKTSVLKKLISKGKYPFRDFLQEFDRLSKSDRDLLSRIEPDHGMWLRSDARKLVTEHDFGPNERIDGLHYAHAVAQITLGGHMSATGLEWYKPFIGGNPQDSEALLTRALLGNQVAFFDAFKPTKIHKEAKNIFKLFEETRDAFKAFEAGEVVRPPLASQQLLKNYPFYDKALGSIPGLKNLATVLVQPLILVAGGISMVSVGDDPWSKKARETLTKIMVGITAVTGPESAMARVVTMTLSEAVQYWESMRGELARRMAQGAGTITGATGKAGTAAVGKLRNVVLAGGMSLAMAGHYRSVNGLIDVWIFTTDSAEDLAKKAASVGRSTGEVVVDAGRSVANKVASAGRAAGTAAEPAARTVARAAGWTGEQLVDLARGSAKVMSGGAASFSAAGALLHGFSITKAIKTLEHGSQDQRTAAWFGIAGSGLGAAGALFEVAEQIAKERKASASRLTMLKLTASRLSAAGLFIDASLAALNAHKRAKVGDDDSANAHRVSAVLFGFAGLAGWMAASQISAGAAAASAGTASAASAGLLGLSWTGWGLILIGLAIGVGYIATLLQDTPTEEWTAKTIWGSADADAKWGSMAMEQQELNKLLMGIRVEFDYSTGVQDALAGAGMNMARANAGLGGMFMKDPFENHSGHVKSVDLRLWMPEVLRNNLEWSIGITLEGRDHMFTLVYSLGRGVAPPAALSLPGLGIPKREDDNDFTHIKITTDARLFPAAKAQVQVLADAVSGDYVVDQTLSSQ